MRSFVGAYKVLSRVLLGYADLLDPLGKSTAGKQSPDRIMWDDNLLTSFRSAQTALNDAKVIALPQLDDTLWVATDAAVKSRGIATTLYALREGKLVLCGFLNAKLRKR